MKNKFLELLLDADILGQNINLKINKRNKSNTYPGAILIIIIIFLSIYFFYFLCKDLINKTNPTASVEQKILTSYQSLQLNSQTFPIAFGLTGNSNVAINFPQYFSFIAYYVNGSTLNVVYQSINYTNCKKENFPNL